MQLTLYYHPETRAFRVRWLLEELGLDYDIHYVDLFAGEANSDWYKQRQPHACLPALDVNGESMFETSAICHWLTDQCLEQGLAPLHHDTARRAYTQWMYYVPATMEPPLWYEFLHSKILPDGVNVPDIIPWCQTLSNEVFEVLDHAYRGKNYLINGQFSTVDLMIASMLLWQPRRTSHYPELKRLLRDTTQRPAYQRARSPISG